MMSFYDTLVKTLTNEKIVSAILSSLFIIVLGYYCRKRNIFSKDVAKVLTQVVLAVSVPALALRSFMQDIDGEKLQLGINVLILGVAIHLALIFLSKPLFFKFKGDSQDTMRVLSVFGSTTFFGIPIVSAIYGADGALYASIFNIGYRIFLYSYGYIKMSGLKMTSKNVKTIFLNPIVIATLLGLLIWVFQAYLPQVSVLVKDAKTGEQVAKSYAFLRIDQTVPWLQQVLTYLAGLCSPLAWLAIGATLGEVNIKDAISDKPTWFYTISKLVVIPAFFVAVLVVLTSVGILPVNVVALGTITIMLATPPATVSVAYAINFDKDALLSSKASLLATVVAVMMAPVWIVIIQLISHLPVFGG